MKTLVFILALAVVTNAASVAIAHLKGTAADSNIDGTVYFVQLNATHHWVTVSVTGITVNATNLHGLHVHAYGDLTDALGNTAGGHFAGAGSSTHACEDTDTRHEGDLGNWNSVSGVIQDNKTVNLIDSTGSFSIIGKALVLHGGTDDCVTQPTGNSGNRIAIGVIGVANPAYLPGYIVDLAGGPFTSNAAQSADGNVIKAVAVVTPTTANSAYSVSGTVTFEQDSNGAITVTGRFSGLTSTNAYGLHIHTFADYYTGGVVNGTAAGGHFDPPASVHGAPPNATRHVGDLGNICSYDGNTAYYQYTVTDGKFTLNGTNNNILGRNLIVHDMFDTARPDSVFGQRIAQGVIGVLNSTATGVVTVPSTVSISEPLCLSFAPTPSPTPSPAPTPTPTSTPAPVPPSSTTSAATALAAVSFLLLCLVLYSFVLLIF